MEDQAEASTAPVEDKEVEEILADLNSGLRILPDGSADFFESEDLMDNAASLIRRLHAERREARELLTPLAQVARSMKFPASVDRSGVFIWAENGGDNLRISLADADAAAALLSRQPSSGPSPVNQERNGEAGVSDHEGDPDKQPVECPNRPNAKGRPTSCPHIENTYEGMDGERWACERCGLMFFLDYEDMK